MAGLHWNDINFEQRTIHINKSRTHNEDQPTKTAKSVRRIEVTDEIIRLLEILPSRKLGIEHAFVNKEGRPMNGKKWSEHNWAEPLKKLQIRHRKFYATRHTFITEMVKTGRMIKAIADYVGTSMTMIENNYAGVLSMKPDREIFVNSKEGDREIRDFTREKWLRGRESKYIVKQLFF